MHHHVQYAVHLFVTLYRHDANIFRYRYPQLVFVIDLYIVYCEVTKYLYTHNIQYTLMLLFKVHITHDRLEMRSYAMLLL